MPASFSVVTEKVTDQEVYWGVFLFYLHYVTFQNQKLKNCETFFDLLHIKGKPNGKAIKKAFHPS